MRNIGMPPLLNARSLKGIDSAIRYPGGTAVNAFLIIANEAVVLVVLVEAGLVDIFPASGLAPDDFLFGA